MAISHEYIAELSRRTDISELVRGYVQLKRSGRMEKGLCPFHNEKTPSFYVYPETSSFYCFGCGAGGDAVTFIKQIQNLDYVEAVKFLAARAGMPMPNEDDGAAKLRTRLLALNREAAVFYASQLNANTGREARGYLRGRRLTDATIRRFGIGYAPNGAGALRDHLKARGFGEEELTAANLCKKSERGGLYDTFRGRIMFPIIDLRGSVTAFGGRIMPGVKGPKYLNSSDTPVFKKGRGLFALNVARKAAVKRIILAEGYMDVISLHQAGFTTAVATLGTALTPEQARLIADFADEAVICYDSDDAGQRATQRAISIFKETPVKVRVLAVPGAKDPDEFIAAFGPERFGRLLEESGSTVEYALDKAKGRQDTATDDGRVAYIREALEILAAEALPAAREVYAGRIAEQTGVSKAALLSQLEGVLRQRRRRLAIDRENRIRGEGLAAGVSVPYAAGGKALGAAVSERQLMAAVLKNPDDFLELAARHIAPRQILSPEIAEAYALVLKKWELGEYIDLAALSGELPQATTALLSRILAQNHSVSFSRQDVELFIGRIVNSAAATKDKSAMSGEELLAYRELQRVRKMTGKDTDKENPNG